MSQPAELEGATVDEVRNLKSSVTKIGAEISVKISMREMIGGVLAIQKQQQSLVEEVRKLSNNQAATTAGLAGVKVGPRRSPGQVAASLLVTNYMAPRFRITKPLFRNTQAIVTNRIRNLLDHAIQDLGLAKHGSDTQVEAGAGTYRFIPVTRFWSRWPMLVSHLVISDKAWLALGVAASSFLDPKERIGVVETGRYTGWMAPREQTHAACQIWEIEVNRRAQWNSPRDFSFGLKLKT
ncbi:hypothetical protein BD779DRAFT_1469226 [Infundibulicybe gibba]|nr:hypothetical protein BD779DRAFT_1469226 [Infundibulicybe gibba]